MSAETDVTTKPEAATPEPTMQVVGRAGKRRDPSPSEVLGLWKTDILDGKDPDSEYQYFHEDQVRDKLRSSQVTLKDFETGEVQTHKISGWSVVHDDNGAESQAGFRPDEGKPLDTVKRHGPMVCMKIPKASWELLQRAQGQRADGFDVLMRRGRQADFNESGQETAARGARARLARVIEKPFAYESERT